MKRPKGIYAYRRGDTWTLRIISGNNPDGSPKFRTFGGYPDEQTAYDDAPNKIAFVATNKTISRHDPTVYEFLKDYVDNEVERLVRKGKRSTSTKRTYEMALNKFKTSNAGGIKLNKLTPMDIQDWVDELNLAPRSIRTYSGFLAGALKFAESKRLIDHSPFVRIEIDAPSDDKQGYWTPEQAELFLKHNQDDFLRLGVEIAIYGGLRIGEICALTWADYDKKAKVISVTKTEDNYKAVKDGTKGHKGGRVIPVSDQLEKALEAHEVLMHRFADNVIGINIKSRSILLNSDGGRMKTATLRERFYASCEAIRGRVGDDGKKLDLPAIRFHDLRHTFVTLAYDAGVSLEIIAEITGHSSKVITEQIYLHILESKKLDAVNRVGLRVTKS